MAPLTRRLALFLDVLWQLLLVGGGWLGCGADGQVQIADVQRFARLERYVVSLADGPSPVMVDTLR